MNSTDLRVVTEASEESDPRVARDNATKNANRFLATLPESLKVREDGLVTELARIQGSALKKLRALHRVTDEFTIATAPHVACRRGCSACCHIPVSIFPVEAELIEKRTGHQRLPSPLPVRQFLGVPCPFLNGGICTIYDSRPMVCRQHVAFTATAYWCQVERCYEQEMPMMGFSNVQTAFETIVDQDGRRMPLDIRQIFSAVAT